MNEEEYLEHRLEHQLKWFSDKSRYNQNCFKRLRFLEIVSASLIPFLSGMADRIPYPAWIIGSLGVVIAVSAAVSTLYKYHENWIEYRTAEERLKHEKYLYLTGAAPYHQEDKFTSLVARVELLLAKENKSWAALAAKAGQEAT